MILETVVVGAMEVNCYVLAEKDGGPAIIIDPGEQSQKIQQVLDKHKLKPVAVINTHGHYDHIGSDDYFSVPVYVHKLDEPLLRDPMLNLSGFFSVPCSVKSEIKVLEDNQVLDFDSLQLKVMHVPGHTPGGVALLLLKPESNKLFTGDTLFCQGIGRSDLAGGSEELLAKSIKERLFTLPMDTVIYPGHGDSSTIGREMRNGLI